MRKFMGALILIAAAVQVAPRSSARENDIPNDPPRLVTGILNFTKQTIGTGMTETHAVVAADLDGDGDIDAVATNYVQDDVVWFENDGMLGFSPHTVDAELDGAYPCSLTDLDLDGDIDVLATGYLADVIVWYENDGTGGFTRHDVDTVADGAHSVVAGDLDQDGDQDLLATNQDEGVVIWYENDGFLGFTRRLIDAGALGAKRAEMGDLDGDGDLDVVAASFFLDEVAWYENDGSQVFTKRVISATALGSYYVVPADLDGDGDLDLAGASQLDDSISWYENDGAGGFTGRDIDTAAQGARMVQTADLDGDGDLDIVATSVEDDTVAWYENGGGGYFVFHAVDLALPGAYGVWTVDMDRDGALDILAASRDGYTVELYRQWRSHGAALSDPADSLAIRPNRLLAVDGDDPPGSLAYTLRGAPVAGEVRVGGAPQAAGGGFTQEDINFGRVWFVSDGSPAPSGGFSFSLSDGAAGATPAEGIFKVYPASTYLSYWPLDETDGLVAGDLVGTNDGTLEAGPVWQPGGGVVGGAVSCDGVDDRIDLGAVDVTGDEGLTISLWIYPQNDTGDMRLVSKAVGVDEQDHFWMVSTYQGKRLRFRLKTEGITSTVISSQEVLAVGQWYHVACTYDLQEMRIYLDGNLIASLPKFGAIDKDPLVLAAIGNMPAGAGNNPFWGLIDEVRLHDRPMWPAEIFELANLGEVSPVPGSGPGTVPEHGYRLLGNVPNPFNPATTIRFEMREAGQAVLDVFDLRGRRLRTLVAGHREAGLNEVVWDGRDDRGRSLPSGTYLYRLDAAGRSDVDRMTLVR